MESIKTQRIPYSQIRVMFDAAKKLEREGREIIHLEIGRPDFNTPPHIVEAAVKALREGKHHYSQNAGIPELRQAIVEKFKNEYRLDYDAETEIIVTNGVAEGVYVSVNALLNPGDQILVPDPAWVNYIPVALTSYAEPVVYSLYEKDNFQPDLEEIKDKISSRTKMIVLVSPSNPTGNVLKPDIVEGVARLAKKHNLLILSDEIYEKIIYAPACHTCVATLEDMRERTLILNGFSKFYSMTGWRIGYVLGPKELINPILRYHQYMITSTNTFAQWGAIMALKGDQGASHAMVEEFKKRRDYLCQEINNIPGFSCLKPDGAFYIFPSVEKTGMDGYQVAQMLLEKAGVATVAGGSFGSKGTNNIRISYANSLENIEKAVIKIKSVLNGEKI